MHAWVPILEGQSYADFGVMLRSIKKTEPGVVAHAYKPSTQEPKAGQDSVS